MHATPFSTFGLDSSDRISVKALSNFKLPNVSVIIITKERHTWAEKALQSVLQTDYPAEKRQIVVVEETNVSKPIGGKNVLYHSIPEKKRGFAYARNVGLHLASHPVVVFVDDDCQVEPGWLRELVRPLMHDHIAAVAGAVLIPDCGPVGECENILGFPGGGIKYVYECQGKIVERITFSTCNCAIRRNAIEKVGGFDEALSFGGEDEILSRKIALDSVIVYNPKAIVRHKPRDSLVKVFLWFIRRGRSKIIMAREFKNSKSVFCELIRNSAFLRIAAAVAVFTILGIPVSLGVSAIFVLYFVTVLSRFRWSQKYYPSISTFLLLPLVKALMDIAMDVGIVLGFFTRQKN